MHLIISIDLSSPGFTKNPGEEAARILHRAAEQLAGDAPQGRPP